MGIFNQVWKEEDLIKIFIVFIVLMLVVFNQEFGLIYYSMLIAWFAFFILDRFIFNKSIQFPLERPGSKLMSFVWAIGGFVVMYIVSAFIYAVPSASAMFKVYGTSFLQATKPALQSSIILLVLNWSVLIGAIETQFTAKVLEAIWDKLKSKKLFTIILLCLFIGGGFTLFHLTSKGNEAPALAVTFVFFTLTAGMIIYRKQTLDAVIMHILWNGVAVLYTVGVIK